MFQFVIALMRAVIFQPHLKVEVLMLKLFELRGAVTRAQNTNDGLTAIVEFFNATSPWHDNINRIYKIIASIEKANYGQYDALIAHMKKLVALMRDVGRNGTINKSSKGEVVTEKHVFLGDIFGIWTFNNIQYWRTRRNAPKGCWSTTSGEKFNPYDIVCGQAHRYVANNAQAISTIIMEIEKDLRELESPTAELAQTR